MVQKIIEQPSLGPSFYTSCNGGQGRADRDTKETGDGCNMRNASSAFILALSECTCEDIG